MVSALKKDDEIVKHIRQNFRKVALFDIENQTGEVIVPEGNGILKTLQKLFRLLELRLKSVRCLLVSKQEESVSYAMEEIYPWKNGSDW